ncbi:ASCH domain-containing protein [Brevundimonas fluminis]|uniref:ASCH domain-containing protein n=1 Tax=Brevundimonas fluminis TaxID=2487274 RepID=UPI000F65779D|nr:ASCH domain-containing protein [Brevundimonas fluminis]
MLFRREILDRIATGEVTVAFRVWRRPTVRAGGRLMTAIGELAIDAVTPVEIGALSEADARRSGAESLRALVRDLSGREGMLYRIDFRRAGPDRRVALAGRPAGAPEDRAELDEALARLDRASRTGPWTLDLLTRIDGQPETPARRLADELGMETLALKRRVRQLKALGLTESLRTGYRLSPRGRDHLRARMRKDSG